MKGSLREPRRSGIREIMGLRLERGGDIVSLEIGEPDFVAPEHVHEAVLCQARAGARYTATAGRRDVREAAAAKLQRVERIETDADSILFTQGSVHGIGLVFHALLEGGDEVVLPDPAWPNYRLMAHQANAVIRPYGLPAAAGYLPDLDEIAALIGPRTKLLVVNSPSNPTGAVLPGELIAQLVELARRSGVVLLSDEAYDELTFEVPHVSPRSLDADRVVAAFSLSKTYAMTGYRVGYLLPPPWLLPRLTELHEANLGCISELSQAAALAAFTGPQDCVATMRETYRARRDLLFDLLLEAGLETVRPSGAFYCMVPLADGADARACAIDLLDAGVAVAPGTAFGEQAASEIRLSLAASEADLREGVRRLARWHDTTDGGRSIKTSEVQRAVR